MSLSLIIDPTALQAAKTSGLLIVDVGDAERYAREHIPGAIHLDYDRLIVKQPPAMGMMPDAGLLSLVFSELGLNDERQVVAYDDAGGGKAARLLYTLDCLGHPGWSYLDGGWAAWLADGGASESGENKPQSAAYQAHFRQPQRIVDAQKVLDASINPDNIILDCRSAGEYDGSDVRAARGGHIPNAVNLDWMQTKDPQREQRFHDLETLREQYADLGITPNKRVILHCQTHHRSAHSYVLLKALGFDDLAGYPGSWSEWGNNDNLPVA